MKFRKWLESLELQQTIPPSENSKDIWVQQPNNPQQIAHWQKQNTRQIYQFPLAKDKFIHFTLRESLQGILDSKEIQGTPGYPTYAVSLSYGMWLPVVQYNHIIRKKGMTHPKDAKDVQKKAEIQARQARRVGREPISRNLSSPANLGEEIVAILFQTDKMPKHGHRDEVVWDGSVPLKSVRPLSSREAIRMLKHTPYEIGDENQVNYV